MKTITPSLLFTFMSLCLAAQNFPSFKVLRYNEDYSNINTDSIPTGYTRMKHLKLWRGNAYLSLGGSARYQFINVENEDWGETPESSDVYGLARHMLHVDFHAGSRWRTFVGFQSSLATEMHDVSPLDENPLELHQAFVDCNIVVYPTSKLTLRLGRQELLYGSQRLVSVRNGPNNRQAFDGIKMLYVSNDYNFDLFYSRFVIARPGSLNDVGESAIRLWGAYLVKYHAPVNIDLYYLGIDKALAVFDDGAGRENRHSIGTRIWKQSGRLNVDIECLYQFGRLGGNPISAWTASFKSEYKLAGKINPTIGVKTEVITGDTRYDDGKLNTFNPLFPSGAYFGLAALFGPANLIDFHPSLTLSLSKKIEWNCDYDIFWRHSLHDGIYTNNMHMIYTGRNNSNRFIGSQLSTDVGYSPGRFITISGEFKWFITGRYLDTAGEGKDILFGMLSMEITF
jgi:hypothetical protein